MITVAANVATLFDRISARSSATVLWAERREVSGQELLSEVQAWENRLSDARVGAGSICAFSGDYSLATVSLMLALLRMAAVSVPLGLRGARDGREFSALAGAEWDIDSQSGRVISLPDNEVSRHPLYGALRTHGHPGLVVFTSGSTGRPKAIVHDMDRVTGKFRIERPGWRTVLFLLIDHFGGVNTLLSALAHGGVGVCLENRSAEGVCRTIQESRADLLPTTPSFLSVLVAAGNWRHYDLSSIRLITYGAEPMPESTLRRSHEIFPSATFKQTYGLSELGVLRSSSPDPSSLWLRLGGDGFETRVVDGILHIRSASSMLGYLNAPSPIDADGWMNTGDLVEERNGLMRFLGRRTEVINVGGEKVYPAEVESVLMEAPNVAEATVYPIRHSLLGQVVGARVAITIPESSQKASSRLREHCRAKLPKYKVPMRIEIADLESLSSERAKKIRSSGDAPS